MSTLYDTIVYCASYFGEIKPILLGAVSTSVIESKNPNSGNIVNMPSHFALFLPVTELYIMVNGASTRNIKADNANIKLEIPKLNNIVNTIKDTMIQIRKYLMIFLCFAVFVSRKKIRLKKASK